MFQIDLKSRQSIYEQVISNIKKLIVSGVLKTDDKLPSVRELSRALTVNPNTVQKAYRELESQGFIYTVSGRGCFVSPENERKKDEEKIKSVSAELKTLIEELIYLGVNREAVRIIVDDILSQAGRKKTGMESETEASEQDNAHDQLRGGDLK